MQKKTNKLLYYLWKAHPKKPVPGEPARRPRCHSGAVKPTETPSCFVKTSTLLHDKKTERREDFVVQEEVEKKETVKTRFYLVDGLEEKKGKTTNNNNTKLNKQLLIIIQIKVIFTKIYDDKFTDQMAN